MSVPLAGSHGSPPSSSPHSVPPHSVPSPSGGVAAGLIAGLGGLFYENPRLLLLSILLIVTAGLSALQVIPRQEDPILTQRFALIKTIYPGASPERVEALVTKPIEDKLVEVEEIKTLESNSSTGISIIAIELDDNIYAVDSVWSRVRDKLSDVEPLLPAEAFTPEYQELYPQAQAIIVSVRWDGDEAPNATILSRLANELGDSLRAVSGTAEVKQFGAPNEEVLVEVDALALAARGLTPVDVAQSIRGSDAKVTSGQYHGAENELLVELDSELDSLSRVRNIPLRIASQGGSVRVGDLAEVSRHMVDPPVEMALDDGRPAIFVAALTEPSRRIDVWAESARLAVAKFQARVPRGITAEILYDQSRYTVERLNALWSNLILGILAVLVCILVLMGWRSALLVGCALPLSALMVVAGMQYLGIPLNQMSITGLIIALGLLIDNAIVVVDEVGQALDAGERPGAAIRQVTGHLAVPLAASTLTTVIAFAPIALMPGPAGEFVGSIALSVMLAVVSSLFVSLTVVAALTGLFRPAQSTQRRPRWYRDGLTGGWISPWFRRLLAVVLHRPALGIVGGMALSGMGFVAAAQLQEQFFPPSDRDQFLLQVDLPAQSSIGATHATAQVMRERMLRHPRVKHVHFVIGRSGPAFYYNLLEDDEQSPYHAEAMVQLDSAVDCRDAIRELQDILNAEFPAAQVLCRQLEQGPPFDAPVEVRILGPDVNTLHAMGNEVRTVLANCQHVVHTQSDLNQSLPKLSIALRDEDLLRAGLSQSDVAGQLAGLLEGQVGGSILESTEELPVRVRLKSELRGELDRIENASLAVSVRSPSSAAASANGGFPVLPLASVGDVSITSQTATISRLNRQRINTVRGYITAGVLPADVLSEFTQRFDPAVVTGQAGYRYVFAGEAGERDEAINNLAAKVGVLGVVMMATLVLSFQSFRMAGLIAVIGALAVGMAMSSLWLFDYPFGFMAIVGTMGLIGVAINDSIVVLAGLEADPRARLGDADAAIDVVVKTTRHVIATTVTTVAGFLPLFLAGGGFWPPLAVAISGGVLGATLLALFFVPPAHQVLVSRRAPGRIVDVSPSAVDNRRLASSL